MNYIGAQTWRIGKTAILLSSLLLMACADRGERSAPAALQTIEGLKAGAAIEAAAGAGLPAQQWWMAYGDSQLDRLVDEALTGSPTLVAAAARVNEARALAGVARSAELPQLAGKAELVRNHFTEDEFIPPPYAGAEYWDNKALLDLDYDLDLWGKQHHAVESSLDKLRAAQAQRQQAALALQTGVVRTYLQLALAYALRGLGEETLQQRQQVLDIAQRRLAAGLGTRLEVTQAQTTLPSIRNDIEQTDERIALLRNQLAALCGRGPGDGDALQPPTLAFDLALSLPDAVPARWIGRRPDLVASRWRVEAAAQDVQLAQLQFYPDIDLKAFAGVQSLDFDRFLSNTAVLAGVGPAVTLPIFNGGRLRSQLGARDASYDLAVSQYNDTLVQALREVSGALVSLRSATRQIEQAQAAVASAQLARALAVSGYQAGLTEFLNVLTTQLALLDERRRDAQARARRLDAYAELIEALGGGVGDAPPAQGESRD